MKLNIIRKYFMFLLKKILFPIKIIYYSHILDKVRRFISPIVIRYKFANTRLKEKENFLRLHLGCGNIHFSGYINIDQRKTKATDYVCDVGKLPFPNDSVEIIETYHMIEHLPQHLFIEAIKNWWKKLIPGGRLVIECPDFDMTVTEYLDGNERRLNNIFGLQRFRGDSHLWGYNFTRLKNSLEKHGYRGVKRTLPSDYHRLSESCIRVEAYKSVDMNISQTSDQDWHDRKLKRPHTLTLEWRRNHLHARILDELKIDLFEGKKAIALGCGTGELETLLAKKGYFILGIDISYEALQIARRHRMDAGIDNIHFVQTSIYKLPFEQDSFDTAYAIQLIEHLEPDQLAKALAEIKRILKPNGKFLMTTPNKAAYSDPGHRQLFTKGTLAKLLDNMNIYIDWISLEERQDKYRKHDLLKAMVTNKPASLAGKKRKICALGAYALYGYTQLGFHWDGQARAFKQLGHETLLLDIRKDTNYENLRSKILDFQPDFLWCGIKDCIPFLQWMAADIDDLRRNSTKVIYWYCDLRRPDPTDLGSLIDFLFLSNAGQLEDYRKAYGIENVFYMPQACTPSFMHRLNIPEIYDIGHAGSLSYGIHNRRTALLKKLSREQNIIVKDNVRNYISNFYSQCKLVFGSNPDYTKYLYTSNRFFIALGCGALYLCEWFPGIEKLVKNQEHLVWFKTKNDLYHLIDYYLKNNEKRHEIRKNAQKLAHEKHTYIARIENIFDIIDGKTSKFYGFLKND
jgi:SAM-dependent methyltransferase